MRTERREPVDLGNGLVREYFPERRKTPQPPRRPGEVVRAGGRSPRTTNIPRDGQVPEHRGSIDKRPADPRIALAAAIDACPYSYAALSRMIDKPAHFLRRFVLHGVPSTFQADDHRRLATFFGVDERALGVRDLWRNF